MIVFFGGSLNYEGTYVTKPIHTNKTKQIKKSGQGLNCTKTKMHEETKLHEGTKLHECTKLHVGT